MAGEASDEDAAWRELVAQYSVPAADGGAPWPVREDLSGARQQPPGTPGVPPAPGASRAPAAAATPGPPDAPGRPGAEEPDGPGGGWDGPDGEDGPGEGPVPPPEWGGPVPGVVPAPPQFRIVRPAVPQPLEPAGDDEHFVPPVPPPLPRLDPVTKGAWVALFGGPGYLLIAVMLGWVVPGWAGFCAVAAFVGGFATLVVRLGDRPPRDSGPDDGAVV